MQRDESGSHRDKKSNDLLKLMEKEKEKKNARQIKRS